MRRVLSGFFVLPFVVSCASLQTSRQIDKRSQTKRTVEMDPQSQLASADSATSTVLTPRATYRDVKDSPEVGRYYQQARQIYDQGNVREAVPLVKKYAESHPEGQFVDEARMILAKEAYDNNDFDSALRLYRSVSSLSPASKFRSDAVYFEALCLNNLGKRKEALFVLSKLDFFEVSFEQKPKVFPFWGKIAADEGKWLEATLAFIKARKEHRDDLLKVEAEALVLEQIEGRLNEAELNFVLQEYPVDFPSALVQLRLAGLRLARGEKREALEMANTVYLTSSKGSLAHQRAQQFIQRLKTLGEASPTRIGVVLPLSGRREVQGRAVLDGLQLAFHENAQGAELVLADSGPTVETAIKAFERLVLEDKVVTVVGPLAGDQAEATVNRASEYGVPYIALSPRPGLLEKSQYIFRLSMTPERQVRALVGYARDKLGAKRFAIMFPEDGFGKEFATEYMKAVEEFGGVVTAAESYDPKQSDFKVQIENMVGLAFPAFRRTEFAVIRNELEQKLGKKPSSKEISAALNKPIVDFEVLFIPDTFRAVGQIAPALLYYDVSQVHLMGPSTWNNSQLLSRAGQYLDKALFVDVFSQERQSTVTQDFVKKYSLKYGSYPSSLAAQGYDVGKALLLAYSKGGAPRDREDLRHRLENLGIFDGVLGVHNWDKSREALAELQIYEIRRNRFNHLGGIKLRRFD